MKMPRTFQRREFLRTLSVVGVGAALGPAVRGRDGRSPEGSLVLAEAGCLARLADGSPAEPRRIRIERIWEGQVCHSQVVNRTHEPVALKEIVLFRGSHDMDENTAIYGESFQMLSQTYGTLGQPVKLGYDERRHYRMPEASGAVTVRSLLLLSPRARNHQLLAFASCRRFSGEFRFWPDRYEIVLDTEDRTLGAGECWDLEEFVNLRGTDGEALRELLVSRIERNHPRLPFPEVPTGWCSWYCFGEKVTEADILRNLDAIAKDGTALRYIQIDDGFQPAHGDWLDPNPEFFPRGIKGLCHEIRARGFEPAIWVAPFIAGPASRLLREHPEWFVQGPDGAPLSADKVTFRGWNQPPWYMLDATIPAVQAHLERIFRVMREEWGCTYFKLDANFWGAVHGSRYADPRATRIENYRRGMEAIRRGASDAFILGCNAPMWASLGLVHGMRVTGDINRRWRTISGCARENFFRNWQHGRLWISDPDCVLLSPRAPDGKDVLSADEISFHAAVILASGGMTLSSDDYPGLTAEQKGMLRRMLPPTNVAARFVGDRFEEGWADLGDGRRLVFVFNWDDVPRDHLLSFGGRRRVTDFWTDASVGSVARHLVCGMPARSARVFVVRNT